MRKLPLLACLLFAAGAAHAQSLEDVGDTDSFGREMIFLGRASGPLVTLREDCSAAAPPELCTAILAAPASTSYERLGLATVRLPARASNSLVCYEFAPVVSYTFNNRGTTDLPAGAFVVNGVIKLRSPVLTGYVNPNTGVAYNGEVTINANLSSESLRLRPGDLNSKTITPVRTCAATAISKRVLRDALGMSAAQAERFFNSEITLEFGLAGQARLVTFGFLRLDVRVYGDDR